MLIDLYIDYDLHLKQNQLICCLALLAKAQNSIEQLAVERSGELHFETSHKRPDGKEFQTSHKIPRHSFLPDSDLGAMNLLPTKERPELNPVLSALINEDVMKSIEAKRAIEKEELEQVKAEIDAARKQEEERRAAESAIDATYVMLTTAAPATNDDLDEEINVGFVDQAINLDAAGSENSKKSRIEIKKGPNGQDYEYEYVYYYEDEEDAKPSESPAKAESTERGKSRYSNIERTTAAPTGNSLVSNKAKGRSSSIADNAGDDVEVERLPANTRFPSRGKNVDAQPTPALDSLENAAERKKISVKRPSLELVDSATFNTDEKQVKGIRNSDTETKSAIAIEQEQAAAAAAQAAEKKEAEEKQRRQPTIGSAEESATGKDVADEDVEQTTLSMEKAALDLYAILANENFNIDMTTDADTEVTTVLPDSTNPDEAAMTTLVDEEPSSTTTTTTTTTTEATTTTTTTTTTTPAPTLFGGKRAGLNSSGRNRFKLNKGGKSEATTTTTTEAPSEPPKTGKNRFSRPSIGGRARPGARTTTAAPAPAEEEGEVAAPKEVKPVSSGFGRGRPRNRFNIRSTTTTEKPASADGEESNEEAVSSTTARSLRGGRPTLGLRGRSRTTTVRPAAADEEHKDEEAAASAAEEKPAPVKPASRFARPGANRLLPRGKLARTTEAPAADDSAAD
ncbi:integumentary mucin C.1-like, partial [Rhagoletis pomonella]|uniref:integumentary mucin C.1-like n=1 Tax=Rhagoletis pomonella TaxID=28610 RepID=UPI00177EA9B9